MKNTMAITIETTINNLTAQQKEQSIAKRKRHLKVQRVYPSMALATNWAEWDKASAKLTNFFVSSNYPAFSDEAGFNIIHNRMLKSFWEKETINKSFENQYSNNLARKIYAYKCKLHQYAA